jgi:hypothetical protein
VPRHGRRRGGLRYDHYEDDQGAAVLGVGPLVAAAWLAWKVWTERDAIFAKIEQASAELQEKLGLSKPST